MQISRWVIFRVMQQQKGHERSLRQRKRSRSVRSASGASWQGGRAPKEPSWFERQRMMHMDVIGRGIPISCIMSSASLHGTGDSTHDDDGTPSAEPVRLDRPVTRRRFARTVRARIMYPSLTRILVAMGMRSATVRKRHSVQLDLSRLSERVTKSVRRLSGPLDGSRTRLAAIMYVCMGTGR